MKEPMRSVAIASGGYSVVALLRFVGVLQTKPELAVFVMSLDSAVFAVFLVAVFLSLPIGRKGK